MDQVNSLSKRVPGSAPRALFLLPLLGLFLTAAVLPAAVSASVFKKAKNHQISNLERINDDAYFWANSLTLDGIVTGDLSAFCYEANINGEVGQSLNIFSQSLTCAGRINGSMRAFCQNVNLSGIVSRSALMMGGGITCRPGSVIERDLHAVGNRVTLDGTIKGNAVIKGDVVTIGGVITGDVDINADEITIAPPAVIAGNLTYTSKKEASIDVKNGVTIKGTTTWSLPKSGSSEESGTGLTSFIVRLSSLLAAFLFGIIVMRVFRPYAEESLRQLRTRLSISIASGLLGVGALAVCLVILVFSLACMVAGFVLISSDLAPIGSLILVFSILMVPIASFAGVTGGIIFYSGKIATASLIGYLLLRTVKPGVELLDKSALFLGLLVLAVLFAMPHIGLVFYIIGSIIGAGGILLGIKNCRPAAAIATTQPGSPNPPPPVIPSV